MIYLCNSMFIKLGPYNLAQCWLVVPLLKNGTHFNFCTHSYDRIRLSSTFNSHLSFTQFSTHYESIFSKTHYLHFKFFLFKNGKVTLKWAKFLAKYYSKPNGTIHTENTIHNGKYYSQFSGQNIIFETLIIKTFSKH